jgi:hypothetical protein
MVSFALYYYLFPPKKCQPEVAPNNGERLSSKDQYESRSTRVMQSARRIMFEGILIREGYSHETVWNSPTINLDGCTV